MALSTETRHRGAMTTTVTPATAAAAVALRVNLRRRLPSPAMRRALRASAGLSAAELASTLGVTRQAVSKWERGDRTPRGEHLESYIAVLEELATQAQGAS